jgi:hypothetical protein
VHFLDQHQIAFSAPSVEACSGSGLLRDADADGESILLSAADGRWPCVSDATATIASAPESHSGGGTFTAMGFA